MAMCPKCEWGVNTAHVVRGEMTCPHCRTALRFNSLQHAKATAPGLLVALAILFNMLCTVDPLQRAIISMALLVAWLVFFRQYKRFLRSATLEIKDRMDAGQDI